MVTKGDDKGVTVYYANRDLYTEAIENKNARELVTYHFLTGEKKVISVNDTRRIGWNEIPAAYRADAFSLNQEIRNLSGNKSSSDGVYLRGAKIPQSNMGKSGNANALFAGSTDDGYGQQIPTQYLFRPVSFNNRLIILPYDL